MMSCYWWDCDNCGKSTGLAFHEVLDKCKHCGSNKVHPQGEPLPEPEPTPAEARHAHEMREALEDSVIVLEAIIEKYNMGDTKLVAHFKTILTAIETEEKE